MYINNVDIFGLEQSLVASGYPMRIDIDADHVITESNEKDTKRAINLASAAPGSGHPNYRIGIIVQFDLCISNKAWVEAERYHWLDFVSSCSTMHRVTTLDIEKSCNKYVWKSTIEDLNTTIKIYNNCTDAKRKKEIYLEILYNLPAGFELPARMTTNYEQLATIYRQRRNHRLPDWHMVCDWIETLPLAQDLIIGGKKND